MPSLLHLMHGDTIAVPSSSISVHKMRKRGLQAISKTDRKRLKEKQSERRVVICSGTLIIGTVNAPIPL
jgi:hypothetical protein